MNAWIQAQNSAMDEKFAFCIVFTALEATSMIESNAREAMKGAIREYGDYNWMLIPSLTAGEFVVQGSRKTS
jgi:hypothetical protein